PGGPGGHRGGLVSQLGTVRGGHGPHPLRVGVGGGLVARMIFKGLEEYELRLSRLGKNTEKIAGAAIYEAASIVTDEIKKGIQALPVVRGYGTASDPLP